MTRIRMANHTDASAWAGLRSMLWPETGIEDHRDDIERALESGERAGFIAANDKDDVVGFAEAALRHDYVNGCSTSPVAFLEGLFVIPLHRSAGVGRSLCDAILTWARSKGCAELASDSRLENKAAHAFHLAVGFEESERVVYYRKAL